MSDFIIPSSAAGAILSAIDKIESEAAEKATPKAPKDRAPKPIIHSLRLCSELFAAVDMAAKKAGKNRNAFIANLLAAAVAAEQPATQETPTTAPAA